MEFSFYLENNEKTFDKWLKSNTASYSNLTEGTYVFHAKSRDILGNEGEEISFVFTILPPWYRTIWAYIVYVFSLIVLIILIIKLYTRTLKERNIMLEKTISIRTKTIVEQKQEIEHKHKEITDSINYAERIQRSFLATEKQLNENLNNYFVLFKPKDVVSGDFYWSANLSNGNFALVTADSTGHGVPGAIMSLLNVTSLEKAIEHFTNPADILNHTRQTIIERLKKDGSEEGGKDGMDCSLLAFDFVSPFEGGAQRAGDVAAILHIAAANNPVWIIRENEMIEIKPDKMPVGKNDKQDQSFTTHTIELQKGDTIYTLTDGFPDQFGGEKGKKFMSKKLKELLLANVHLPIAQQKELLDSTFKNWVGDLEQVDDVTVVGIRI
jgi:serine phosphatase RsbU (regulator of sigma subunit)